MFQKVNFGDPEYDGPYLRANRGDFDGPERVKAQTDYLEAALQLPPAAHILDIGCGIGTYTHALAQRGYKTIGLDISTTFLQEARQSHRADSPLFVRGNYRALPFGQQFQAVIMTATPFIDNRAGLVAVCHQICSVLTPGGTFLFDYSNKRLNHSKTSYPQTEWWREGEAFVLLRNDWHSPTKTHRFEWYWLDPGHNRFLRCAAERTDLTPQEIVAAVAASGLHRIKLLAKWETSGHPPGGRLRLFDEATDRGFVLVASKATQTGD
ncbi:MAG: methyltransferase domain-containing protein [Candidatus Latescibacteria bacterium]|nr:methyltransferase domain-containing protein [Candidatus Latescibacterota bacterium]